MNKSVVLIFLGDFFFDARCINMADTIIDSGMELNIIDSGGSDNNYQGKNKYRNATIYHIDLQNRQRGILRYWKFHIGIIQKLRTLKFDTLISADLFSIGASTKFQQSARVVYDSREIYSELAALVKKPHYQFFWLQFEKYFIRKCDSIIVTAESDGLYLKSIFTNILEPIVIKNLPSSKMMDFPNPSLRKHLNISDNQKIFLYQGVIQHGRGLKIMIDLLEHFPDCVCVFIGEGGFTQEVLDYAKQKQCENKVFFIGAVPYSELLSYTTNGDIGFSLIEPISKSYIHALPNKLFEYFLAGIPAIASDFPEMKNAIQNYLSGAVVSPNNFSQIVDAVSNLLNSPYNREENQRFALDNFVWESQKYQLLKAIGIL